jgi:hypothetical protein
VGREPAVEKNTALDDVIILKAFSSLPSEDRGQKEIPLDHKLLNTNKRKYNIISFKIGLFLARLTLNWEITDCESLNL